MKQRRKLLVLLIALAAIAAALIVQPVLAYYTTMQKVDGELTTGKIEVKVQYTGKQDEVIVIPGSVVEKTVSVKNTGSQPCYLRLKLVCTMSKTGEETLPDNGFVEPVQLGEGWTKVDGYYYYNEILEVEETTSLAFEKLMIVGSKVGQEHIGWSLNFDVVAEAVQSQNNPKDKTNVKPWDDAVKGWPKDEEAGQ